MGKTEDRSPKRTAGPGLSEAARRALVEAEERRRQRREDPRAKEIDGPKGLEPTRYGDWERKGIASDF